MAGGQLIGDIMLAFPAIDRAAHLREAPDFHDAQRAHAMAVIVRDGEIAVRGDALALVPLADVEESDDLTFLGLADDGVPYYLLRNAALPGGVNQVSLREVGARLDDVHAGLAVMAVAIDRWRAQTQRCARCGDLLTVTHAGWALVCPSGGEQVFPRMDPAAIVLVIGADDRVALGRHVGWPEGRFSTFAGFVEAGESAEAAAVREVFEETGLRLERDRMEYLGSQPWPFPQSLMLGYHAHTSDSDLRPDVTEIAEARWFSRDELRAAIGAGEVTLPLGLSISRKLIERWLEG